MKLREVRVVGYRSVLDPLPGVRPEDVIAMRVRKHPFMPPEVPRVLIRRRNLLDNPAFREGWP